MHLLSSTLNTGAFSNTGRCILHPDIYIIIFMYMYNRVVLSLFFGINRCILYSCNRFFYNLADTNGYGTSYSVGELIFHFL